MYILPKKDHDKNHKNFKKFVKGKKLKIYDMRNIYSKSKIEAQGFKYFSVGS